MRITIIGFSGSGKTTLAKTISEDFSLPNLHLDRLWFEAGGHILKSTDHIGKEKIREVIKAQVEKFITEEAWVSDGLYGRSQVEIAKRATIIIFLDIPLWKRISNHLTRTFRRVNRHPELTIMDDLHFLYELIKRTYTYRPIIQSILVQYPEKVVILCSRRQIRNYVSNLKYSVSETN